MGTIIFLFLMLFLLISLSIYLLKCDKSKKEETKQNDGFIKAKKYKEDTNWFFKYPILYSFLATLAIFAIILTFAFTFKDCIDNNITSETVKEIIKALFSGILVSLIGSFIFYFITSFLPKKKKAIEVIRVYESSFVFMITNFIVIFTLYELLLDLFTLLYKQKDKNGNKNIDDLFKSTYFDLKYEVDIKNIKNEQNIGANTVNDLMELFIDAINRINIEIDTIRKINQEIYLTAVFNDLINKINNNLLFIDFREDSKNINTIYLAGHRDYLVYSFSEIYGMINEIAKYYKLSYFYKIIDETNNKEYKNELNYKNRR